MNRIKLFLLQLRHWLIPRGLFAVVFNLIIKRANRHQWRLNIGSYLLRKGVGYEIGQVLRKEALANGCLRVTYITGFSYDFEKNKVIHRTGVKIITPNEKGR